MSKLIEKQVIVNWYTPDEKMPEDDCFVIVTVSGKFGNVTYDHALLVANWMDVDGWYFEDPLAERFNEDVMVHAWADLEPYGGD